MRTTFTEEEIVKLEQNPCVFSCTAKVVNYTYEFKKRALELQDEGVSTKEIWRRANFDIRMWKEGYFRCTLRDWRLLVKKNGLESLLNLGGVQFDRGPKKDKSDQLKRLELQVKYLQAENDFLAKLRAKRAESNSGQMKNIKSLEN